MKFSKLIIVAALASTMLSSCGGVPPVAARALGIPAKIVGAVVRPVLGPLGF